MAASSSVPEPAAGAPNVGEPRRGFFAKVAAVVLGTVAVVCPFVAGVAAFADPLRRKGGRTEFLRVAPLDAVPANGMPVRFPVIAARRDAWNLYPAEPIGAVYLRRSGSGNEIEAFNDVCPHLGCRVSFVPQRDIFQCPCHTSAFALDGQVLSGPSPRALDTLDCEIHGEGPSAVVWVKFEEFYTGRTAKVAKT